MATCVGQQSSKELLSINYLRKLRRRITYDARIRRPISSYKRFLSEQCHRYSCSMKYVNDQDGINKRTKRDFTHESNRCDEMQYSVLSFLSNTQDCRSVPELLRRNSLTHLAVTYINDVSCAQASINFLPSLSTIAVENKTVASPEIATIVTNDDNDNDKDNNSDWVTSSQLATYINNKHRNILIIDCGLPLRHNERRIKDSFLLNVNDKISRKRLSTRGLKNFLDNDKLNRLDESEIIILYDDGIRSSSCPNSSIQSQILPPMKFIYDQIKQYQSNKIIYILRSSFDEFFKDYPSLCYICMSTYKNDSFPSPSPDSIKQRDIDSCQLSKILPGLYLGSSRDAQDFNLLKSHKIKSIINISTSIPCYFKNENIFEYLHLPCHDSPNQNILQYFKTTFEYIHKKLLTNENILVHCQGGISRSPSFLIGYLIKYHSKTFDEAYHFVKDKRNIIDPNIHFISQLTQYQQMLTSD